MSLLSTQLVVSVVGKQITIAQQKYMQDMTSALCNVTNTGVEVQLEDKRDGQLYWVGKMKDGKCWMLQNLALDITADGLKASDTNVSSDWNSSSSYKPVATSNSIATGGATQAQVQSWSFGKWVLATPLLMESCVSNATGQTLANCTKVGFVDVSSTNFQPTYTATTRSWNGANSNSDTLVAVNCTTWSGSGTSKVCTAGTYDPHYLVGNYYSWGAATAGTGGNITSGEASGSICPKGWRLPTSNTTTTGSFGGLLSQYGVSSSLSGTISGTTYNIAGAPLRLVRGGYIDGRYHYFNDAGLNGSYRSSTPYSSIVYSYHLSFDGSSVTPSGREGNRYFGRSVRCVSE